MVKRSGRSSSTSLRNSGGMPLLLMMECWDESLSQTQIAAYKEKVLECQRAQEKVREAHRLAQLGKAIVTVLDDPRKRVPPPTLQQLRPDLIKEAQAPRSQPQEPQRPTSPDIIFIGESPPVQKTPPTPPTQAAQARAPLSHTPAVPRQIVQTLQMPGIQLHRFPSYQPQTTALQIQGGNIIIPQRANIQNLQQLTPVDGTYGLGVKRTLPQQQEDTSPKRKRVETDNQGNWVPLDEFYYGKMEGDPTYSEEKNEFRFKCWYCSKMLYNNIKAMMHIQGHIDSSKQQNIDLSDLTQCKHCYRQFDTPFEMQTHVEKVHMNNVNVLMCRICERDHQSRQALMTHMRVNHNACEMPYICHLCKFRSSMYSDVVDHFKKKHDSSQHILCLYCLKVFAVKFVSQGWGQTQTYYGHLLKHQSKSNSKKCTFCRLTFVNPADCKTHKKKDHAANQKGIDSRPSMYGQDMMIKVPDSGLSSKQALKSLNAPAVSKVLDFGGTRFPYAVNYNSCVECKTVMGTPDHFRKHIECSMCRFATSCSIAYANHMMGFHSGQMSSLNLNIPWERPMKEPMHCLCGFVSRYGNKIANHLVYCTKRSCYSTKPAPVVREMEAQEDTDPRYKAGASLLDALGLVKKKNVSTKDRGNSEIQRRRSSEEPSEVIWKSTKDSGIPATEEESQENDEIPRELKGAEKWKTVKIQDPSTPSKASVFLGEASEPIKDLDISRESEEGILLPEGSSIEKEEQPSSTVQSQSEENKQGEDDAVSAGQSNEETTTERQPQGKNMEESLEENEQSFSEDTPDVVTENVDGSNEKTETDIVKQEMDTTESEIMSKTEILTEQASQSLGSSDSKEGDGVVGNQEMTKIKLEIMSPKTDTVEDSIQQKKEIKQEILSPDKDSTTDSVQKETNSSWSGEYTPREAVTDLSEGDKENETLTETTEEPTEKVDFPVSKEAEHEKDSSKPGEMEGEPLEEEKTQNQEGEDAEEDLEMEGEPVGQMKETNVQDEEASDDVSEEKAKEESSEETLISESREESKKEDDSEMKVREVETIETDEEKKKEEGLVESGDVETRLEEKTRETEYQSEMEQQQETEEGGKSMQCENKTREEEMEVQSHLTGNKSSADGGAKRTSSSRDGRDKREIEGKDSGPAEGGESQRSSESTDRGRGSHQRSSPEDERRSDDVGRHSSHHHGNRSHGNREHRSPNYNQYDRPQEDRSWSRHDRHSHGDRDKHHGQNRHYHDNRHQYDRNRYDDGRHGHHDNRHGYHDNRHGYHDNRSSRGHWRGHGGYRGGYRDYR